MVPITAHRPFLPARASLCQPPLRKVYIINSMPASSCRHGPCDAIAGSVDRVTAEAFCGLRFTQRRERARWRGTVSSWARRSGLARGPGSRRSPGWESRGSWTLPGGAERKRGEPGSPLGQNPRATLGDCQAGAGVPGAGLGVTASQAEILHFQAGERRVSELRAQSQHRRLIGADQSPVWQLGCLWFIFLKEKLK